MFTPLLIGLSGIRAANQSILTSGHNIANADVSLYHRIDPILTTSEYESGVKLSHKLRIQDDILQNQLYDNINKKSFNETILQYMPIVESYATTADILQKIDDVYSNISRYSIDRANIHDLLSSIDIAVRSIHDISTNILNLRNNIGGIIDKHVNQINENLRHIADFNLRHSKSTDFFISDNIDSKIKDISEIIDIKLIDYKDGVNLLTAEGSPLVLGDSYYQIDASYTGSNIFLSNTFGTINTRHGKLGALLFLYNDFLPRLHNLLNNISSEFIRSFNHVNATGIGRSGELTTVSSTIPVPDINAPLASQNLPYNIYSGHLVVSVTDIGNNTRTNYTINIDPSTQSLLDISNFLSSIPGIASTVSSQSGLITINSLPGFRFDFAGRDTVPPSSGPISDSDTAGILSALGINGLFEGYNADTIRLRQQFIDNPFLLSSSRTGEAGNTDNLVRFLQIRDKSIFTGKNIEDSIKDLLSNIGSFINTSRNDYDFTNTIYNEVYTKLQEVIGVDTNEEFTKILVFQKMLQSSSKYISIVNNIFDTLLGMLD